MIETEVAVLVSTITSLLTAYGPFIIGLYVFMMIAGIVITGLIFGLVIKGFWEHSKRHAQFKRRL